MLNPKSQAEETILVLSVSHKIDFKSNPHPLPWILMYNQNAEKAAVNPDQTTPHYHESKPSENPAK